MIESSAAQVLPVTASCAMKPAAAIMPRRPCESSLFCARIAKDTNERRVSEWWSRRHIFASRSRQRAPAYLHVDQLGRVRRLEAERIESKVARRVARAEALERGVLTGEGGLRIAKLACHRRRLAIVRVGEGGLHTDRLGDADGERHTEPEWHRQLRDLLDRGSTISREEWVPELLHEEASGRTAVGRQERSERAVSSSIHTHWHAEACGATG